MNWSLFQCVATLLFFGIAWKLLELCMNSHRGPRKNITIAALVLVFFMSGISLDRGWPSRNTLPNEFIFIHAVVQDPTETNAGQIVMLIRTKDHPNLPYSVILPYTEELGITLKLASMQVITEGEIPVSYTPGKGYTFHLKPAPSTEDVEDTGTMFNKPFLRSA